MRTPHDTLCHSVFRHHACASAWVVSVLPGRLSQWIDWSAFQPANGHVSGLRLRSHHADLVFTARLLGGEHRVLFVIEHKSSPDEALHWQVLRYSVHLAHSTRRRHGALPFLLPLVLTHGGSPIPGTTWPDAPAELVADFAPHQPAFRLHLDDLSASSEAALLARDLPALLRLVFLCLQHARGRRPEEVLAALDRWRPLLRSVECFAVAMSPAEALDEIGWYLVDTTDLTEDQVRMAFAKHLDHPEEIPMTTGQRIRLESRNLGREEGKEIGKALGESTAKAQTLLRQLRRRFRDDSEPFAERVLAATVPELDRWLDRILDAESAAAVCAD